MAKSRAAGVTSYFNSVRHLDITSEEVREMEKAERRMDLVGQTVLIVVVILVLTLIGVNYLRASDPYDPVPGAYDDLTTEQVENLESEREASRMIDEEVSRGGDRFLVMEATAYTWTGNQTASGTWPKVGTVATDPTVIPTGTRLWVEGYGYAVAEDTGGLVKGHIVDVYLPTESECWQWGRRMVEVRVIE